ncbi:MAG: hypothetical protein IKW15_04705, partial [Bacteroidales bacterium]|nr:hypothetical protein [Bacteroidales bacterium]
KRRQLKVSNLKQIPPPEYIKAILPTLSVEGRLGIYRKEADLLGQPLVLLTLCKICREEIPEL